MKKYIFYAVLAGVGAFWLNHHRRKPQEEKLPELVRIQEKDLQGVKKLQALLDSGYKEMIEQFQVGITNT